LKRLETLLGGLTNDGHTSQGTNGDQSATATPISSQSSALSRGTSSTNDLSTPKSMMKTTLSHDNIDISNPAKRFKSKPYVAINGQPRYVDDVGILSFLSKKFNLADERVNYLLPTKIRRIGKNLVMVDEEGDAANGRTLNQLFLENIGILKPGEPVLGMED
jgi:hypothetical protein